MSDFYGYAVDRDHIIGEVIGQIDSTLEMKKRAEASTLIQVKLNKKIEEIQLSKDRSKIFLIDFSDPIIRGF